MDTADAALPDPKIKNDLRRMALVMAVAAIDAYMHGVVLRRLPNVRWRTPKPKPLRVLTLPFEDLASLADAALEAQRSGNRIRPWVQVKNALQNALLQQTFQSYDQVGRAFALAGVSQGWRKVAAKLPEPTQSVKVRLDAMVHRRNQIAHEGDLARVSRPQKLKFNPIDAPAVRSDVDWVETLINAMEAVVAAEP